ncbi:hypothetical protein AAFN85_13380 [Mucilaginibacter sp. CAU 1740]|uniref:hypothetical protein n=1 Tax=Mucilaginibacter sp. CAU 1740 TaxID=3140365 RepID=UPI00325B810A
MSQIIKNKELIVRFSYKNEFAFAFSGENYRITRLSKLSALLFTLAKGQNWDEFIEDAARFAPNSRNESHLDKIQECPRSLIEQHILLTI